MYIKKKIHNLFIIYPYIDHKNPKTVIRDQEKVLTWFYDSKSFALHHIPFFD